jgi:hypothetical protein
MSAADPVGEFLAEYPSAVTALAVRLRAKIRAALPDAAETLDRAGRVVGYSVGPGYAGLVCTIIPSKNGVKLGVVDGATLRDPHGLLEGAGKKHRYVQFKTPEDVERRELIALLRTAATRAKSRS